MVEVVPDVVVVVIVGLVADATNVLEAVRPRAITIVMIDAIRAVVKVHVVVAVITNVVTVTVTALTVVLVPPPQELMEITV